VKESAQQGVEHVRDDGSSAVQGVKETASNGASSSSNGGAASSGSDVTPSI
jgi:hypothetical protein